MFSIAKSLVSIAHSLEELVEIQRTVLGIAQEQSKWTRERFEELKNG